MESLKHQKLTVRAPGRINLLGEHLDYNHGLVLPAAIDRYIDFFFEESTSCTFNLEALDLGEQWQCKPADLYRAQASDWQVYLKGVLILLGLENTDILNRSKDFKGLSIRFTSNIPIGAGLSSSAALCCGFAFGLNEWFGLGKSKMELALIAQQTEHQFAGVNCGLMDQVASLMGKADHLIAFDCHSHVIEPFSLPLADAQLFLIDSKVKHNLATSAYNERRSQLERAFEQALELFPDLANYRDLQAAQATELMRHLDSTVQKRLQYVLDEMTRVQQVRQVALELNALASPALYHKLGCLLSETHQGLRDLYEVSCPEVDFLQSGLLLLPGIFGARMMGGGFGGCLLVLARSDFDWPCLDALFSEYHVSYQISPRIEKVSLVDGVHLIES
jgi:galactokinase